MQRAYIVQSYGYSHCPEFSNLAEARKALSELVASELKAAKRKSKTATKHRSSTDSYTITLGKDRQSALWSAHLIVHIS